MLTTYSADVDVQRQEIFRPKRFRHLHSVISTGAEEEEGIIPFHGIFVNSPEPHIMDFAKRKVNEQTPYLISYTSTICHVYSLLSV